MSIEFAVSTDLCVVLVALLIVMSKLYVSHVHVPYDYTNCMYQVVCSIRDACMQLILCCKMYFSNFAE